MTKCPFKYFQLLITSSGIHIYNHMRTLLTKNKSKIQQMVSEINEKE